MLKCVDGEWSDVLVHHEFTSVSGLPAQFHIYVVIDTFVNEDGCEIEGVPEYTGVTLCVDDGDAGEIKFRFGSHAHDVHEPDSMSIDIGAKNQAKYLSFYDNHFLIHALQSAMELNNEILIDLSMWSIEELCETMEIVDDI